MLSYSQPAYCSSGRPCTCIRGAHASKPDLDGRSKPRTVEEVTGPVVVNLDATTVIQHSITGGSSPGINDLGSETKACSITDKIALLQNLRRYGWSPIRLCGIRQLATSSNTNDSVSDNVRSILQLEMIRRLERFADWKAEILSMFDPAQEEHDSPQKNDTVHTVPRSNRNGNNGGLSEPFSSRLSKEYHKIRHPINWCPSESGAAGAQAIEPKSSWEMARCFCALNSDLNRMEKQKTKPPMVDDGNRAQMHAWMCLMHALASYVCEDVMEFPRNTLLQGDSPCCVSCNSNLIIATTAGISTTSTNTSSPVHEERAALRSCNVDLLRAFRYDPVLATNESNRLSLGSSPHTDWGSWTVVYPDPTINGLQTFCHSCQQWSNVTWSNRCDQNEGESHDDDSVMLVLHAGDITSIAVNISLQHSEQAKCKMQPFAKQTTSTSTVVWPSPLHRVISPAAGVDNHRVSLVYFVYPPPHQTLQKIIEALLTRDKKETQCWIEREQSLCQASQLADFERYTVDIPFHDYFLLQNQSPLVATRADPLDQLASIRNQPLHDVLRDKWKQVQRDEVVET